MQAAVYSDYTQDYSNIKIQQVAKPVPAAGQVLVKVNVAAINPVDAYVHRGWLKGRWYQPFPFVPGYDLAGVVDSVGAGVDTFAAGDRVFAVNWDKTHHGVEGSLIGGAFAQYALIDAGRLSKTPAALSDELAAAVALVGTTAYEALFEAAKVTPGSRVLVLGGASAVGSLSIQLLKNAGVHVITTSSERSRQYVAQWRPDQVIDYTKEKWETVLAQSPVDVVFDTVGDTKAWERAQSIIKPGGAYVSIVTHDAGFDPTAHPPFRYAAFFALTNRVSVQDELARLLVEGKLKLPIQQVFPFTDAGVLALYQASDAKTNLGKNLLRISGN